MSRFTKFAIDAGLYRPCSSYCELSESTWFHQALLVHKIDRLGKLKRHWLFLLDSIQLENLACIFLQNRDRRSALCSQSAIWSGARDQLDRFALCTWCCPESVQQQQLDTSIASLDMLSPCLLMVNCRNSFPFKQVMIFVQFWNYKHVAARIERVAYIFDDAWLFWVTMMRLVFILDRETCSLSFEMAAGNH